MKFALIKWFYPVAIYLFKVNDGNTRIMYEIRSELTIKTPVPLKSWQ